jgi:hypothetical protein
MARRKSSKRVEPLAGVGRIHHRAYSAAEEAVVDLAVNGETEIPRTYDSETFQTGYRCHFNGYVFGGKPTISACG